MYRCQLPMAILIVPTLRYDTYNLVGRLVIPANCLSQHHTNMTVIMTAKTHLKMFLYWFWFFMSSQCNAIFVSVTLMMEDGILCCNRYLAWDCPRLIDTSVRWDWSCVLLPESDFYPATDQWNFVWLHDNLSCVTKLSNLGECHQITTWLQPE